MQAGFVKGLERTVSRVDYLNVLFGRKPDKPVEDLVGLMVLAVHVEQDPRPDPAFFEGIVEAIHPQRLDEKEIEPRSDRIFLDFMDEKVIRIQFMGHHQIVNARHKQLS